MTPDQLRAAGLELFGPERGWQTRMAAALRVSRGTLWRWLTGIVPIPGPVEACVACWLSGVAKR